MVENFSLQAKVIEFMLTAILKKKQTLRIKNCFVLKIYGLS